MKYRLCLFFLFLLAIPSLNAHAALMAISRLPVAVVASRSFCSSSPCTPKKRKRVTNEEVLAEVRALGEKIEQLRQDLQADIDDTKDHIFAVGSLVEELPYLLREECDSENNSDETPWLVAPPTH